MNARCPLCGNQLFAPLRGNSRTAGLHRCRTCGLVSVREMPSPGQLRAVYGEAYFRNARSDDIGYEDYEADRYCIWRTAHRRLDIIERHVSRRGRLLDVGCALGFFVDAARRRGWQAEGVDISEHAIRYARDVLSVKAAAGTIHEAGYAPGSFDVITAWDVIEHVPDPVGELRYMRSLLREGGLLVLSTPDIGSLVARVTGPRWMGFKLAEEHLVYFDRNTIALALAQAGFEIERVKPIGKDVSLDFFARRLRLYAGPLAWLLEKAIGAARLGRASIYANPRDILMVVARKS